MGDIVASPSKSVNPEVTDAVTFARRPIYDRVVPVQVAERIRRMRVLRGFTSERELSVRAGLAATQLSNVLRQLDDDPGAIELRTVFKIAAALQVRDEWLLTGEGPADIERSPPERWPNRQRVLELFAEGLDPETLKRFMAIDGPESGDWPARVWLAQLDSCALARPRVETGPRHARK